MRWYSQAGTPKVTVRSAYDPETKTYRLDLAQSLAPTPGQTVKAPAAMPLALGLIGPNGGDLPLASSDASAGELATGVFELKDERRSIVFRDVPQRPTLSFLRGFSAPVRVDDDLTEEDLIVLAGMTATTSTAGNRSRASRPAFSSAAWLPFAPAARPSATGRWRAHSGR